MPIFRPTTSFKEKTMPFEIVGLDFVGREGREEDMAGVDGDTFVGGKKSPIEQARSIALAYKKKNKLYGPVAYLKSDPSVGDYVFSVGRGGFTKYIRVLNGTASLSRKQPKLGAPPSVSGWWPFSRQMTPQEAEQKVENIMQKQNIQMGQGKVVPAKDLANSIVAASKELGGQEIAKGYVLTVLIRKGMGFMDSQGQTHWPSFAPQKA
jgi:hypothetical protein